MNSGFFKQNYDFQVQSLEHVLSSVGFVIFFTLLLLLGRKLYPKKQERNILYFACFLVFIAHPQMLVGRWLTDTFDHTKHIPLHLCNIMGFLLPIALILKNRKLWSVMYYWIMLGTIQSLVTPTLQESFPHYEYWRYFIIHAGLVILALYPIFVYRWRLSFSEGLFAAFMMNMIVIPVYFIDLWIGANYMFMLGPPDGDTIYNLLGDWPKYFLHLEWFTLVGFGLLTLPFYYKWNKGDHYFSTTNSET